MPSIRALRGGANVSRAGGDIRVRTGRAPTVIRPNFNQQVITRQGEPGVGLEYDWRGTQLGVRRVGTPDFDYRELGLGQSGLGGAAFFDGQYTAANPLIVDGGPVTLPVDASASILGYAPPAAQDWWDPVTNLFKPGTVGAWWALRIDLKARPLMAERDLVLELDIGAPIGVIWSDTKHLRAAATVRPKPFGLTVYTLDTFVQNGGQFLLYSTGPVEVYDFAFLAARLS